MDSQGRNVLAASYLAGTPIPQQLGTLLTHISLDSNSNVLVGGNTFSADFPLKSPFVSTLQFSTLAEGLILAQLSPDLSSLAFSSFLSSSSGQLAGSQLTGLTTDSQDNAIVTGTTFSRTFPTTQGSFQPALPGTANSLSIPLHSFISKLDLVTPAPSVCFDSWNFSFGSVPANTSKTSPMNLMNCGNAPLHLGSLVSSDPCRCESATGRRDVVGAHADDPRRCQSIGLLNRA